MTLSPRARARWARGLTLGFFALALFFSVRYARQVDWPAVGRTLAGLPPATLLLAAALAAASHALYACFDLLGRAYTGHRLPPGRVLRVTFISYAFNLNMGSLVGGIGLRLRLYSRLGLDLAAIGQVLGLSMLTNWLGYLALAGALFALAPPPLPPGWALGGQALRLAGLGLLALAALYLALCVGGRHRRLVLRGQVLPLPTGPLAAVQLGLSCANWAVMGALVWSLLQRQLPYPVVLGTLLLAAVAGVLAHVPAGLGVLEAVFLALLTPRVAVPVLLAALLAYRALYYLVPWGLATASYLLLEGRLRRGKPPG